MGAGWGVLYLHTILVYIITCQGSKENRAQIAGKPSASFRLGVTPGLKITAELWAQLRTASTVVSYACYDLDALWRNTFNELRQGGDSGCPHPSRTAFLCVCGF